MRDPLRERLLAEIATIDAPRPDVAVVARRARAIKRRGLLEGAGAGLAVAALALVVVRSGLPDPRLPASTVTFDHLPVKPVFGSLLEGPLAPEGFPDCTRDNLNLDIDESNFGVSVTARPVNGRPCGLLVTPDAALVDSDGRRFPYPQPKAERFHQRLLLMGDTGASAGTAVDNICVGDPPYSLEFVLGGETLEVGSFRGPCEPRSRRPLRLFRFTWNYRGPPNLESPMAWLDASFFGLPEEVDLASEETLSFFIEMRNDTDEPVPIGRCPFYVMKLSVDGDEVTQEPSFLNCADAPEEVAPGEVVRFEMEFPVRTNALLETCCEETATLTWTLKDERRTLTELTTELEVVQ